MLYMLFFGMQASVTPFTMDTFIRNFWELNNVILSDMQSDLYENIMTVNYFSISIKLFIHFLIFLGKLGFRLKSNMLYF